MVILRLLLLFKHFQDFAVSSTPHQSMCSKFLTTVYFVFSTLYSFLPTGPSTPQHLLFEAVSALRYQTMVICGFYYVWLRTSSDRSNIRSFLLHHEHHSNNDVSVLNYVIENRQLAISITAGWLKTSANGLEQQYILLSISFQTGFAGSSSVCALQRP